MTTLAPPLKSTAPTPAWPIRHRFTLAVYERMGNSG